MCQAGLSYICLNKRGKDAAMAMTYERVLGVEDEVGRGEREVSRSAERANGAFLVDEKSSASAMASQPVIERLTRGVPAIGESTVGLFSLNPNADLETMLHLPSTSVPSISPLLGTSTCSNSSPLLSPSELVNESGLRVRRTKCSWVRSPPVGLHSSQCLTKRLS